MGQVLGYDAAELQRGRAAATIKNGRSRDRDVSPDASWSYAFASPNTKTRVTRSRPGNGKSPAPGGSGVPDGMRRGPDPRQPGPRQMGPMAWLQSRLQPGRQQAMYRSDYMKIDFRGSARRGINPFKPTSWPQLDVNLGTFWGLLVLSLAYVHHSTAGFALPALLPLITPDLNLTDHEGAMLTVGYTVLYAVALVPAGFLADRTDRPRMLAGGLGVWSLLTMAASKVTSFRELLVLRIGFAAAQSTQNPICFSLIPELFPKQRTFAMAAYNSAIYMGRALSFAAVVIAGQLGVTHSTSEDVGVQLVPLQAVDLSHVSILYTQGDMAAITPIYDYNFQVVFTKLAESSWRTLLFWIGPPGLVIAGLALLTLAEPRTSSANAVTSLMNALRPKPKSQVPAEDMVTATQYSRSLTPAEVRAEKRALALRKAAEEEKRKSDLWASVRRLLKSPGFQAVTAAAALNDVGSWALIGFQATFYSRVYEVGPEVYAPALAAILPIGGLLGGVGGGLAGDWLSRKGGRAWLTAGATVMAAPVLAGNLLAPDYKQSLAFLLVGFALSEMWRAPAAIMIRDVSPPNLGSTGSALHLCVRNFTGSLGPLAVAGLEEKVGLQKAMLVVPLMYLLSGVGFFFAERIMDTEKRAEGTLPVR
ncbi:g8181 [Coccomyxa viridis]|uniref:G8181 protein n=1 Tax=Coccomyxa viridis TaxID=1274662 RepID=A0ABP1FZR0_9CHLO